MKIRALRLHHFKKFDRAVVLQGFSDGLNLIAGPNEMGKSTLLLALRTALFERHGSKSQAIKGLVPNMIKGAAPSVMVEFELGHGRYRIEKRFLRRPLARLTLPNGQVIEGNEAEIEIRNVLHLEQDDSLALDKGSPGHFGVLLIPQRQSFDQPALALGTRHRLEEAITAEIEQLGNQSEVDAVLADVDAVAFEIADRRGKPKGRFKAVEAEIMDLEAEIQTHLRDRDSLAADIDALNQAEHRLSLLESGETEEGLKTRLGDLEAKRAAFLQQKALDAEIASAQLHVERLTVKKEQQQKRKDEEEGLITEQDRLRTEEAEAREHLDALEAGLAEQQVKHQALIEAKDAIRQKRTWFQQLNGELGQRAEIGNALAAIATEVTIDLDSQALDRVRLGGQPLDQAHQVIDVVEDLEIEIQAIGRINVRPKLKELDRLRERQGELDRSVDGLMEALGLEDADPERIEAAWQEIEREAADLERNLSDHDKDLQDLYEMIEAKRPIVLTLAAKAQQTDERLQAIRQDIKADDDNQDRISADLETARTALDLAKEKAGEAKPADQPVLANLEAEIGTLRRRIEERTREVSEARVVIGRLGGSVAVRAGFGLDERLDECYRRLDLLKREQERFRLDARALRLLTSALSEAADDARTQFHAPLAARLTPYVQALLPEALPEVTADFGVSSISRGAPIGERFDQLSDGTREQIAIVTRLAFAKMLKEQGLPSLLVLDDALVFSDEARLSRMARILEEAAKDMQIILLTCREDRFLALEANRLRIEEERDVADAETALSA